jgi:hypothetical protein
MKRILSTTCALFLVAHVGCYAAEPEKPPVQCPQLTPQDISLLGQDRILKQGDHKWYMHDMFELNETLGSHVPLDLTVNDVLKTTSIAFKGELEPHTCQYKIEIKPDRKANVTFKLMGE